MYPNMRQYSPVQINSASSYKFHINVNFSPPFIFQCGYVWATRVRSCLDQTETSKKTRWNFKGKLSPVLNIIIPTGEYNMLRKIIFICKMFCIKIPLNVTNVNNNPITYNKMIWNPVYC